MKIGCEVQKVSLTMRAPDAGDSALFFKQFSHLSLSLVGRLRRPRPSAGNANRWAGSMVIDKNDFT